MKEQWKPVVGYEGCYEVSNEGRVRSVDRYVRHSRGKNGYKLYKGQQIRTPQVPRGYLVFTANKCGKKSFYVHRLVMQAFVGDCPEGLEVCHFDGNPKNNHLTNLRYASHQDNMDDREIHGNTFRGERHSNAILTELQVSEIKWAISHGFKRKEIAEHFGTSRCTIGDIKSGKSWAHIN